MINEVKIATDNYLKNKILNNRILIMRANILADIVQDKELDMYGVISCLLRNTGLDKEEVLVYCKDNNITRQYLHDYIVSCVEDKFIDTTVTTVIDYRKSSKLNEEKVNNLLLQINEGSIGVLYWKEILSEMYIGEMNRPKEFRLKFITKEILEELNEKLITKLEEARIK